MHRKIFQQNLFGVLVILLIGNTIYAQEWAPIGAKWYYSTSGTIIGSGGLLIIESVKDTSIQGNNCRKLKLSNIKDYRNVDGTWHTNTTFEYFYYNSDSVLHYDKINGYFYTLYDFSVKAGDTVIVRNEEFPGDLPYSNFEYIVDSISSIDIDGYQLKQINCHTTYSSDLVLTTMSYPIIEKIGSTLSFLGISWNELEAEWGGQYSLRCYIDNSMYYHSNSYPSNYECDYLPSYISDKTSDFIRIFPIPAGDYLIIELQSPVAKVLKVFNTYGLLLHEEEVDGSGNELLDLGFLDSGLYLLQIDSDTYPIVKTQLIKL